MTGRDLAGAAVDAPRRRARLGQSPPGAGTTKVSFTGVHGQQLAGLLTLPAEHPEGFAIFAHCFTCGKDSHAAARISRALAERGYGVLRFDVTGLGESEGDFADATFSCDVSDLALAADYLRTHHRAPDLLVGHSLGGAAVIAAAHRIPEARAVVTIGAPSDPAHVVDLFAGSLAKLAESGAAPVTLGSRTFTIRRSFVDDIREQPQAQRIATLDRALLVMHAPGDTTVPIANAQRIYAAARHPKSFITLEDADHLLSRPADSAYAAEVIAAWASRYVEFDHASSIPTPDPTATETAPAVDPGTVVVASTGAGKYAHRVTAGRHILVADEPESVGGRDSGPNPYELLLASLGACTAITLRMYADRNGLPLEAVEVTLRHSRIHADDCATCATSAGMVDHIDRSIQIIGHELSEAGIARLLEIADRCPVHRTLTSQVHVDTRLAR